MHINQPEDANNPRKSRQTCAGGERFARTPGQGAMRKHCKARLGFREAALSRQDVRFVVVETIVLNECV